MAEFWQSHGIWIVFGALFIVMIGHHLLTGHGGHGEAAKDEKSEPASGPRRRAGGCH